MKQRIRKAFYEVHSWTGACFGLLLFLICLTGSLSVFRDEIRVWSNSNLWSIDSTGNASVEIDHVINTFSKHYNLTAVRQWGVRLPDEVNPAYELLIPANNRPGLIRAYIDPSNGQFLGESNNHLADFIFQLHANLTLSSKIGRYLVGVLGVAMLMSIVTGVLVHKRIFRDLFTMRWNRSERLALSDAHKATATWALLFHIIIAFSGAFLGLKNLLFIPPAIAIHHGDIAAAKKQLRVLQIAKSGTVTTMVNVEKILVRAKGSVSGFQPRLLTFQNWGDVNARFVASGSLPGNLLQKNEALRLTFNAVSGDKIETENALEHSNWRRIYDAISPLHYGNFGGLGLKIIYFLFGISATTLTWTGMLIWVDRRQRLSSSDRTKVASFDQRNP